jgi:hypothetical protein
MIRSRKSVESTNKMKMNTIKLKDIVSISGKGGLYKYVAQARNGVVVESLEDQKRHVEPATARVSSLEDIAIFTHGEEVPLSDIFMMMHEKQEGGEAISHKSPEAELKKYFLELVPEYDDERVYVSDIRKVFQWYNQLHAHELLEIVEKEEKEEENPADDKEEAKAEDKGKKAKSGGKQKEQSA